MSAEALTALVFSDFSAGHNTGSHPENQTRLKAIRQQLDTDGLLNNRSVYSSDLVDQSRIEQVHAHDLLETSRLLAERGGGYIDGDTLVSAGSYEAALGAAGAAIRAVELVLTDRHRAALALARPPGHHAERERQMGFCLFNNIAVAAQCAFDEFGLERVAIIDWDVHHGNGTQDIFYDSSKVLFCSVHQWPLFPGTGRQHERGFGAGTGYTINAPLSPGSEEQHYLDVFDNSFLPVVEAFRPDLLMVSAGFDAHRDDPLSMMELTERSFGRLAARVQGWADDLCQGRLVLVLEGGYNLKALASSVVEVVRVLDRESKQ